MIVASFVAAQRTDHGVPHALCCRALGLSESWFYKWLSYEPSERDERRERLDVAVKASFRASEGNYGSPRVREDLVEDGWKVSPKTVAASMRRQDRGRVDAPPRPGRPAQAHASVPHPPGCGCGSGP